MAAGPLAAGVLLPLSVLAPAVLMPSPRMRLAAGRAEDVAIGAVASMAGVLWLNAAAVGAWKVRACERIASAAGCVATLVLG